MSRAGRFWLSLLVVSFAIFAIRTDYTMEIFKWTVGISVLIYFFLAIGNTLEYEKGTGYILPNSLNIILGINQWLNKEGKYEKKY